MAECRESEYEADCESEYESNSESKNECDVKVLEDPFFNKLYNRKEYRNLIMNEVIDLTFGHPVRKPLDFETRCPLCPTSWKGEIEFERAQNNGSVSYWMTLQRTDDRDVKLDAVFLLCILNGNGKYFPFHQRWIQRVDMLPGNEIKEFCKDAISAKDMLSAEENRLLLRIDTVVRYCQGRIIQHIESDTSTDG